ncbi:sensor histidine kinase [Cytobacillus suaedae]|nr:sensor histidine kinase [Cytobacillus suaedae]
MVNIRWRDFSIFPKQFGFFPYIWLVYLLFPLYDVSTESGIKRIVGYGIIALFLVTYRQLYAFIGDRKFSWWLALQLAIIFFFCLFYDLNFLFLGFFPANFIGWYTDKKMFQLGLAGLIFVEVVPILITIVRTGFSTELLYVVPFIIIMFITPFGIRSMNKRMDLEKQLEKANQQINELVKREERLRIARDLHDTLGHTLSLLTLKSQLVQRLTTVDPEKARNEAKEIERTSRAALKQVRELVSDMRSATITEELLQVQEILKATSIHYHYSGDTDYNDLPPFTQNIICMCLREAATNIVKHSNAQNCFVTIQREPHHFKVTVQDDGIGMTDTHQFGNGLNGMKERLDLIDGSVSVKNNHGTKLEITLPIIQKGTREGVVV